jgi:selenocysteine lyase/cysteine desulfurase
LLSVDRAEVEERSLGLARIFRTAASEAGIRLVPEEGPSQIVSVVLDDPEAVRTRLKEEGVIAAVRGGSLRLGFHAFNDQGDVEAALRALRTSG